DCSAAKERPLGEFNPARRFLRDGPSDHWVKGARGGGPGSAPRPSRGPPPQYSAYIRRTSASLRGSGFPASGLGAGCRATRYAASTMAPDSTTSTRPDGRGTFLQKYPGSGGSGRGTGGPEPTTPPPPAPRRGAT